jgi:ElaB/YqjD/DUF883 family membrane-anchored ribosome-binding protein
MNVVRALPVGLALLALVGCLPMTTGEAHAQYCKNLSELHRAVTTLTKTDATTSVGQLKDAQKQVQQEMADVQKSAEALKTAKVDDVQKAVTDLDRAVSGLPNDMAIGPAVTTLQPQVRELENAWSRATTDARCL